MSLASRVSGLLHVPPPVLTAYLDVSPGNPRNQSTPRGYIKWLKSAGQALNNELPASARKEFRKQLDRVNEYLQKARPRSRGLVVFAGQQTWEAIPLQVEVAEELHWGNPSLQHMAWLLDEHRLRGAVLIGGSGARFFRFWLGFVEEDPTFAFSINISSWRKPHLVGPSTSGVSKQFGIQRDQVATRKAEQRNHFLRQLSKRIVDWSNEGQISPIILVGERAEVETIISTVPSEFREQMATLPKTFPDMSPSEVNKRLQPALNRWEREYETALVNELISGQETRQSLTGLDQTLDRLQRGEVRELVVARGLKGVVQQCLNCGWGDRTADAVCPICGSKRQSRTLRTLLPELANLQSVPMEVVAGEAARKLGAAGGIGAWLRAAKIPSRRKTNIPIFSRAG